jgi:thiol-disulfide isomerase/thioredoxin
MTPAPIPHAPSYPDAARRGSSRTTLRAIPVAVAIALLGGCSSGERSAGISATPASTAAADTTGPPLVPITADRVLARAASGHAATLVNVWATWCDPCRQEFPELLKVARAHRAEGLDLVLVSADFEEQRADVERFLASHGVTDTSYIKTGDDQKFINGFHREWTGALPATLVLDARGKVVAFWEGRADSLRFETAVSKALAASHLGEKQP